MRHHLRFYIYIVRIFHFYFWISNINCQVLNDEKCILRVHHFLNFIDKLLFLSIYLWLSNSGILLLPLLIVSSKLCFSLNWYVIWVLSFFPRNAKLYSLQSAARQIDFLYLMSVFSYFNVCISFVFQIFWPRTLLKRYACIFDMRISLQLLLRQLLYVQVDQFLNFF